MDGLDAVRFLGEGHTSNLPNPFPDQLTAEQTFLTMTHFQSEPWKRTQLAVNTQPDISKVGNDKVLDLAVRSGRLGFGSENGSGPRR